MAIMLLNIRCLTNIGACLLLSTMESEDATEDVGDWMIRPGQVSVYEGSLQKQVIQKAIVDMHRWK